MPKVRKDDVVWVEPQLVAEVEFAEWTHDGRLRAPVTGVCARTRNPERCAARSRFPPRSSAAERTLRLSNLDKPFWPEEGITKGDLIAYYREVAPGARPPPARPPVHDEALPDGWQGKHFFQKDAPRTCPTWIPTFSYRSTSRATREKRTLRYRSSTTSSRSSGWRTWAAST